MFVSFKNSFSLPSDPLLKFNQRLHTICHLQKVLKSDVGSSKNMCEPISIHCQQIFLFALFSLFEKCGEAILNHQKEKEDDFPHQYHQKSLVIFTDKTNQATPKNQFPSQHTLEKELTILIPKVTLTKMITKMLITTTHISINTFYGQFNKEEEGKEKEKTVTKIIFFRNNVRFLFKLKYHASKFSLWSPKILI